jgi:hypothetical protein
VKYLNPCLIPFMLAAALMMPQQVRGAMWSYSEFDLEYACTSAHADLSCALKTWIVCSYSDHPAPCSAIGFTPTETEFTGLFQHADDGSLEGNIIHRPWSVPYSKFTEHGPGFIFGSGFNEVQVRSISSRRFLSAKSPIAASHEVVIRWGEAEIDNKWHVTSVFFQREPNRRWRVAAWSQWLNVGSDGPKLVREPLACKEENGTPSVAGSCALFVELEPPHLPRR